LFLAAKVEEQPQKLEHVARVYHAFINNGADIDPVNDSVSVYITEDHLAVSFK